MTAGGGCRYARLLPSAAAEHAPRSSASKAWATGAKDAKCAEENLHVSFGSGLASLAKQGAGSREGEKLYRLFVSRGAAKKAALLAAGRAHAESASESDGDDGGTQDGAAAGPAGFDDPFFNVRFPLL